MVVHQNNRSNQPSLQGNIMINIDDLTLGQIKQIQALTGTGQNSLKKQHRFVGKYVICRTYSAGVHAGILISQEGGEAILGNSRRLWQWTANEGVALSGVAVHGLKSGMVDTILDEIAIVGVIETIPCSKESEISIYEYK
jgi:hypothetical protein